MRHIRPTLLCSILPVASIFSVALLAQGPTGKVGNPGTPNAGLIGPGTIRGQILANDSGRPLSEAIVRAVSRDSFGITTTVSDGEGKYTIAGLAPGRYDVSATKSGFATMSFAQTRPFQRGRLVEVGPDSDVRGIDFRMPRGSAITGVMLDWRGDPVSDIAVTAMRKVSVDGRPRLIPVGRPSFTDDLGEYRVFGLQAGDYYVSAIPREDIAENQGKANEPHIPVFYPGTSNTALAQRVRLGWGDVASGVTFLLPRQSAVSVSGTVVGLNGEPQRGSIVAISTNGQALSQISATSTESGAFTLSPVPEGDYVLRATTEASGSSSNAFGVALENLSVGLQNISGVRLSVQPPATLEGRVIVATDSRPLPQAVRLAVADSQPSRTEAYPVVAVGTNNVGGFTVNVVPGQVRLKLISPANWRLRRVTEAGRDITDAGITLGAGEVVRGIQVEISDRSVEVAGYVSDGGKRMSDYVVVMFSADQARWRSNPDRHIAIASPDQSGRYVVAVDVAGEYSIVAVDYVDPMDIHDIDVLERLRERASRIVVEEGQTRAMDLEIQKGAPY